MLNNIYPDPEVPPKDSSDKDPSLKNQEALQKIKERFEKGEIDAKEYNRLTMAFTPVRFAEKHGVPKKSSRFSIFLFIFTIIVILIAGAHIGYFFYFSNTFKADNIIFLSVEPETQEGSENITNEPWNSVSSIDEDPIQIPVSGSETGFYRGKEFRIDYKYYYDISAEVESTQNYYGFDNYATLVPRDVCLAWGSLKNASENPHISFHNSQSRSCEVKYNDTVDAGSIDIFNSYGISTSAPSSDYHPFSNNHLIPSTVEIRDEILHLKKGDKIRIVGYLINVYQNEWLLSSSTRRDDPSSHACEVIYVTKLEHI